MKAIRKSISALAICLWISALVMLWQDDRIESLWVGVLLMSGPIAMFAAMLAKFPMIMEHRDFGGGDNSKVIKDCFGSRHDWRWLLMLITVNDTIGGGYMIFTGRGMMPFGFVYLVVMVTSRVLEFTEAETP